MTVRLIVGDALEQLRLLPASSVHCCVTSPPYYGLRDYGIAGQIGLEPSPDEYIAALVAVFREVRRVLRTDGTLWLNIGDSYNAHPGQRKTTDKAGTKQETNGGSNTIGSRHVDCLKPKDLIGIPWMLAFALRADGWRLRQDIIWSKPNPMPESVTDRCTRAHESIFLLAKSERYYFDAAAIAEPLTRPEEADRITPAKFGGATKYIEASKQSRLHSGNEYRGTNTGTRNKRSVWTVASHPFSGAHFATFPVNLIDSCVLAGCPRGGTTLDPFAGAGTTGLVADRLGRNAILIELNPQYAAMARRRIEDDAGMFAEVEAAE